MADHKHGHCSKRNPSPTYRSWQMMKNRCTNQEDANYIRYGGRGITYHPDWEFFANFLEDMGERPENTSLNRVNNDGPYTKENCVWSDNTEQALNRSLFKNNQAGVRGVRRTKTSWQARGTVKGKTSILYTGPSFEEACEARRKWEEL